MSKRRKKKGPYAFDSRLERQFATVCLHESAHAVAAITQGIRIIKILVFDPREGGINSAAYKNFIRSDALLAIFLSNNMLPGGATFPEFNESLMEEQLDSILAFVRVPESVEKSTEWTDKSKISDHIAGDMHSFNGIMQNRPQFRTGFQVWKAEEQNLLALQPTWDAIEKISNHLRQKEKKMNELEILNFTLEAFFSSLDKATCPDDLLVESYKGSIVPFDMLKMHVMERAFDVYRLIIKLQQRVNSPTDPALHQRYLTFVENYEALFEERGPYILNLGSPQTSTPKP